MLSEKLQELVKLYGILVEENKKVQDAIESELSGVSKARPTLAALRNKHYTSENSRQRRQRRNRLAKYD